MFIAWPGHCPFAHLVSQKQGIQIQSTGLAHCVVWEGEEVSVYSYHYFEKDKCVAWGQLVNLSRPQFPNLSNRIRIVLNLYGYCGD